VAAAAMLPATHYKRRLYGKRMSVAGGSGWLLAFTVGCEALWLISNEMKEERHDKNDIRYHVERSKNRNVDLNEAGPSIPLKGPASVKSRGCKTTSQVGIVGCYLEL